MPVGGNSEDQALPTKEKPEPEIQSTQLPTATIEMDPTQVVIQATPTQTALPTPCYRAELVEETVPDNSTFLPGKWFSKIWIVKNTGVCEWTEDFHWELVDGEDFSAATDLTLNESVLPGEEIKILMELKAPLIPGTYRGIYQILTDEGASITPFGFWVQIVVE
jgi:hypothetical protein